MGVLARKKVKIEGKCPYCGAENSVVFADHYYVNNKKPHYIDLPTCEECCNDEIMVRKINNRRYKVLENQY